MTLKLPLTITLYGQLPSGKNGMGITTEGKRYPRKRFAAWRTEALAQLPRGLRAWNTPVCLIVDYVPGDRRIRDRSGMLDAIFHLLERGRIITNDGLIEDLEWHTFPIDRERPMARLTIVDADEWRRFIKKTQQHF
jgi:hypothetical protein